MADDYRVSPGSIGSRLLAAEERRQERVKAAVIEAATLWSEIVAEAAPKDQGQLGQSVRVVSDAPDGPEVRFEAPHAAAVERGSRPHRAPLEPLVDWVRRHNPNLPERDIQRMAHGLWLKIATVGTAPTWFVRSRLPEAKKILRVLIARALAAR